MFQAFATTHRWSSDLFARNYGAAVFFGRSCRRLKELLIEWSAGCSTLVDNATNLGTRYTNKHTVLEGPAIRCSSRAPARALDTAGMELKTESQRHHVFRAAKDRRNITGDGKTDSHQRRHRQSVSLRSIHLGCYQLQDGHQDDLR